MLSFLYNKHFFPHQNFKVPEFSRRNDARESFQGKKITLAYGKTMRCLLQPEKKSYFSSHIPNSKGCSERKFLSGWYSFMLVAMFFSASCNQSWTKGSTWLPRNSFVVELNLWPPCWQTLASSKPNSITYQPMTCHGAVRTW